MPALKIFHAMILVLIMILPEERKGAVEAGAKPMRSHVTVARLQDFFYFVCRQEYISADMYCCRWINDTAKGAEHYGRKEEILEEIPKI